MRTVVGLAAVGVFLLLLVLVARRLNAPTSPSAPADPEPFGSEQAVLIHIPLSDDKFGTPEEIASLQALELELEQLVDSAKAGEYDGNEIGDGEYVLFMYGPSADRLFKTVEEKLRSSPAVPPGTWAVRRRGGEEEVRVDIK